nr:monoheme cytochrome C [Allomuricauda sp.]
MKKGFDTSVRRLTLLLASFLVLFIILFGGLFHWANRPPQPKPEPDEILPEMVTDDTVENGIHLATGFVDDTGMKATIQNCTNCHSAKLVTQNRMSREGWEATIRWMQETQNLWDLGNNEELILTYLSKNYAPQAKGRRQNLNQTEWYSLK